MSTRRAPVMLDVAKRAGVSHQTVSRVLNNPELVRASTREKIIAAIEDLGYRPNTAARALVTRRTRLIGVINAEVSYFGPESTARAIESAARDAGYATITSGSKIGGGVSDTFEFFLALGVDGLIVVAPTDEIAAASRKLVGTLPIVTITAGLRDPGEMHVVGVDHVRGARDATAHLIQLGHRRIAHIAGPSNWFDARAREAGWLTELIEADLPKSSSIVGGWDPASGYRAANVLLSQTDRPTAVFAANDLIALGLIRRLHEEGLSVPHDIAVVGYDDTPGSAFFDPPLTTIQQPFKAVGVHAIRALLGTISGSESQSSLIVPTLVRRASSGVF